MPPTSFPPGDRGDLPLATDGPNRVAELPHAARPVLLDLADRAELRDIAKPWTDVISINSAHAQHASASALLIRPDGPRRTGLTRRATRPPPRGIDGLVRDPLTRHLIPGGGFDRMNKHRGFGVPDMTYGPLNPPPASSQIGGLTSVTCAEPKVPRSHVLHMQQTLLPALTLRREQAVTDNTGGPACIESGRYPAGVEAPVIR
jgi:hypothetical protein